MKAGQKYESTDRIISSIRGRRDSSQFRGTPAFDAKHWVRPPVKGVGTIVTGVFADRRVEGKDGVEAPTISGPVVQQRDEWVIVAGRRDWWRFPEVTPLETVVESNANAAAGASCNHRA